MQLLAALLEICKKIAEKKNRGWRENSQSIQTEELFSVFQLKEIIETTAVCFLTLVINHL